MTNNSYYEIRKQVSHCHVCGERKEVTVRINRIRPGQGRYTHICEKCGVKVFEEKEDE